MRCLYAFGVLEYVEWRHEVLTAREMISTPELRGCDIYLGTYLGNGWIVLLEMRAYIVNGINYKSYQCLDWGFDLDCEITGNFRFGDWICEVNGSMEYWRWRSAG